MRRATFTLFLFAAMGASCLDPLYEDGAPLTSGWVLCCQSGTVNTCFCEEASSCAQSLFACASGGCSATPVCQGGTGGGAAGGGGGSSAGGGTGTGGGASGGGGGGLADAGTVDAGTIDGGSGGGAGGGAGGGSGGGGAGGGTGGGTSSAYEFCCNLSRVTTCACPSTGCAHEPFTPCPGGSCIAGTSTAICR